MMQVIITGYGNGDTNYQVTNIHGSPVIGVDGTIFCAGYDRFLYALSPDGILKWKYSGNFDSSPAITKDETIYVSGEEYIA